ncbi:MAG TPA: SelB C-terminal domain-containing protein, partial [Candidatus Deferrimicrobiaceae bacterium]
GIVDVPGHERFVRTMVAGAAGIDIVLLVIAIDEGVKPQTREHLDICRLLSIRHGIIVLNKRDRVDDEWAQLQEEEVREFVRGTFLEDAPILQLSALTGQGVPELAAAIDRMAAEIPGKDPLLPFRLPVDRSFTIKGFGTVVTGTVAGGAIRTGDEVVILPNGLLNRVRGLQVHGSATEVAEAGNRAAVNLQGVDKEAAPRGAVLCRPGDFRPTRSVEASIEYLHQAPKAMKSRERVTFHSGTASATARVVLYGQGELPPGGSAVARIDLSEPFVLMAGDRFILRGFAPLANFGYTIGGGTVLLPYPPKRKGSARVVPPVLDICRSEALPGRIAALLEDASISGIPDRDMPVVAGDNQPRIRKELDRLIGDGTILRAKQANGYHLWHRSALGSSGRMILSALAGLHERFPDREGFPLDVILGATSQPVDPGLAVMALEAEPGIERQGDLLFIPEKRPLSVALTTPFAISIGNAVSRVGLAGLSRAELLEALPPPHDTRLFDKTVEALVRDRRILRIKELHFQPEAVRALEEKLRDYLSRHEGITVPEFKEMAGLSRKFVIPLIEYFDETKVTLRVGDRRFLRKPR